MILVALVAAWTVAVGWAVVRLFSPALSRAEKAGWSFAAGVLVQCAVYGALLFVRANPGPKKMAAAGAALWAFSLWRRRPQEARFRVGEGTLPRPRAVSLGALAIAAALVSIAAIEFAARPMWTTDYLAIWGFKARTIFFASGIPARLFRDPQVFWSHPEYPLLVPLSLASAAAFLRRFDDRALGLLDAAFEVATLCVVYGYLARTVSRFPACAGVLLAGGAFALYRGANAGTAEIPFALGVVLLATAFLDATGDERGSRRVLLAIAALFCAAAKQEGTLLAAIILIHQAFGVLLRRRRLSVTAALCLIVPAAAVFAVSRALSRGDAHRDYDLGLLAPSRWTEWAGRLERVLEHLAAKEIPGAAVALAAVLLFFVVTRRARPDRLLPILALQVAAYVVFSSISAYDPIWSIESSFARITMTLVPAFAIVLGARLGTTLEAAR